MKEAKDASARPKPKLYHQPHGRPWRPRSAPVQWGGPPGLPSWCWALRRTRAGNAETPVAASPRRLSTRQWFVARWNNHRRRRPADARFTPFLASPQRVRGMRLMPVLVDLAAGANLRNDDIGAFHAKKDSKTSDSCRSLVVPALQGLRVLRVERIGLGFSIFCRNRSRVGASHCSKYFAAVRERETL